MQPYATSELKIQSLLRKMHATLLDPNFQHIWQFDPTGSRIIISQDISPVVFHIWGNRKIQRFYQALSDLGFSRIETHVPHGTPTTELSHPLFLRDSPELCAQITRGPVQLAPKNPSLTIPLHVDTPQPPQQPVTADDTDIIDFSTQEYHRRNRPHQSHTTATTHSSKTSQILPLSQRYTHYNHPASHVIPQGFTTGPPAAHPHQQFPYHTSAATPVSTLAHVDGVFPPQLYRSASFARQDSPPLQPGFPSAPGTHQQQYSHQPHSQYPRNFQDFFDKHASPTGESTVDDLTDKLGQIDDKLAHLRSLLDHCMFIQSRTFDLLAQSFGQMSGATVDALGPTGISSMNLLTNESIMQPNSVPNHLKTIQPSQNNNGDPSDATPTFFHASSSFNNTQNYDQKIADHPLSLQDLQEPLDSTHITHPKKRTKTNDYYQPNSLIPTHVREHNLSLYPQLGQFSINNFDEEEDDRFSSLKSLPDGPIYSKNVKNALNLIDFGFSSNNDQRKYNYDLMIDDEFTIGDTQTLSTTVSTQLGNSNSNYTQKDTQIYSKRYFSRLIKQWERNLEVQRTTGAPFLNLASNTQQQIHSDLSQIEFMLQSLPPPGSTQLQSSVPFFNSIVSYGDNNSNISQKTPKQTNNNKQNFSSTMLQPYNPPGFNEQMVRVMGNYRPNGQKSTKNSTYIKIPQKLTSQQIYFAFCELSKRFQQSYFQANLKQRTLINNSYVLLGNWSQKNAKKIRNNALDYSGGFPALPHSPMIGPSSPHEFHYHGTNRIAGNNSPYIGTLGYRSVTKNVHNSPYFGSLNYFNSNSTMTGGSPISNTNYRSLDDAMLLKYNSPPTARTSESSIRNDVIQDNLILNGTNNDNNNNTVYGVKRPQLPTPTLSPTMLPTGNPLMSSLPLKITADDVLFLNNHNDNNNKFEMNDAFLDESDTKLGSIPPTLTLTPSQAFFALPPPSVRMNRSTHQAVNVLSNNIVNNNVQNASYVKISNTAKGHIVIEEIVDEIKK